MKNLKFKNNSKSKKKTIFWDRKFFHHFFYYIGTGINSVTLFINRRRKNIFSVKFSYNQIKYVHRVMIERGMVQEKLQLGTGKMFHFVIKFT